jgi:hypothetical protein
LSASTTPPRCKAARTSAGDGPVARGCIVWLRATVRSNV